METLLKKYGFDGVWHFTDRSNLELIKKHNGLLSLGELERREIKIPGPGGNEWSHEADRAKGLHDFVHLAFRDDHPMLYLAKQDGRITNPIWLEIESSILLEDGVRFCSEVSNRTDAVIIEAEEAREQIDFEVLFTYMDWTDLQVQARRRAALKSEILVPGFVPIERILSIKNG
jgi:hypothetical protein